MPTITTVDATWDTSVSMDAAELRRADSAMFLGDGSNDGVRGGIVRHGDNSLAVTVNGSDQVTVQAGAFVIPAATGLGVYRGALSAATAATAISARNATNPRIDLVVIQAAGANATVNTIDGTPGASPTAPALPAQHIELARITVPQTGGGAVTVDPTWRAYATALGGTLYVETSARLPGSGNQKGQRAVALDTGIAHAWDGAAWITGAWQSYTPALTAVTTNPSLGNGTAVGRYREEEKGVSFTAKITFGSTSAFGSGGYLISLPRPMAVGAVLGADILLADASAGPLYYRGTSFLASGSTFRLGADTSFTNGQIVSVAPTVPFTWANTDVIEVSGFYEAA